MTVGSACGAGLLVAWSQVQSVWQLYAVFAALGVAMAMALYEPATAVLVAWLDPAREVDAAAGTVKSWLHRGRATLAAVLASTAEEVARCRHPRAGPRHLLAAPDGGPLQQVRYTWNGAYFQC